MHHIAWNYFHYQFHRCILWTTHFWKTENQVTNLNSSQYMIHHRSLKLDTLSLGYVITSLCIEWEDRRSIEKSPVIVKSTDRRSSSIQPNWYNHRHLGPGYFFSSILSIKCPGYFFSSILSIKCASTTIRCRCTFYW